MPRPASRIALILALPLVPACSAGSDDGLTSLSGAYSAGPADGGDDMESEGESEHESEGGGAEGPITTAGSADGTGGGDGGGGNPLCCQAGPQAGCDSDTTETCVCTSEPLCCTNVWSQECADLAAACGDPFCSDVPGTDDGGSTGEPGGELACDPDFEFSPQNPAPGVAFTALFSDPVGLTWVGMRAEGPGGAVIHGEWGGVVGMGPFTWTHGFDGLAAGVWTFTFTHRMTENGADIIAGTCQKQF